MSNLFRFQFQKCILVTENVLNKRNKEKFESKNLTRRLNNSKHKTYLGR